MLCVVYIYNFDGGTGDQRESSSYSHECDITYFVWPIIILDVNGLSRSKDVATCLSAIQIFFHYYLSVLCCLGTHHTLLFVVCRFYRSVSVWHELVCNVFLACASTISLNLSVIFTYVYSEFWMRIFIGFSSFWTISLVNCLFCR